MADDFLCTILLCFNPRSRTGNDVFQHGDPGFPRSFNPRSRTGNDGTSDDYISVGWVFQSTFPHGERLQYHMAVPCTDQRFQSTFPHGERLILSPAALRSFRFQSTFPHGERLSLLRYAFIASLFQSTFPHGERLHRFAHLNKALLVSIHVPARGTTLFAVTRAKNSLCFNPRSRTGNDTRYTMHH